MAMYWTFSSLPELNHLTEQERHHVLRTCAGPGVYFRLIRSACFFSLAATAVTLSVLARGASTTVTLISGAITFIITLLIAYQFCMRIVRADLQLALLKGFTGERLPVCLGCGYDLKGIEGDRCPECGKGIVVHGAVRRDPP